MTYEKALQSVLMYCTEECGKMDAYRCENKECVEAVVIKALKKQIPKKPYWETYVGWHCKSCGAGVFSNESFCPLCGQAIDWKECD